MDVVLPRWENGYCEPLCAVYAKGCLAPITAQLARSRCKVADIFDQVRVREVPVAELQRYDPELLSFLNVNQPEDLERVRRLAAERGL